MTNRELEILKEYKGNSVEIYDLITEHPIKAMSAVLDYNHIYKKDLQVPEGWHWLYFLETPLQNELGSDGHKRREGFIPPISLPRRMYAGGSLTFLAPMTLGDQIKKVSTIKNIEPKVGSTGNLVFLTVEHSYFKGEKKLLIEIQNLVFREEKKSDENPKEVKNSSEKFHYEKSWRPTPEMLFRYSSLTFNTHRIHYDYPYATQKEGYKNIVVHGPLLVTLILDLIKDVAKDEAKKLLSLTYRINSPVYIGGNIRVQGLKVEEQFKLWVKDSDGKKSLSSIAVFKD